jgi:hypothetical protein
MGGESALLPVIFSEILIFDDCAVQVGYTKDSETEH